MISLTSHDFQGSVEQWGRDEIYPDIWHITMKQNTSPSSNSGTLAQIPEKNSASADRASALRAAFSWPVFQWKQSGLEIPAMDSPSHG